MKKIYLMTAVIALLAMTANAQGMKRISKETPVKGWAATAAEPQKSVQKIATRAGELENNQRYINYSYDESLVWPSDFAADTEGAISLGTLFYNTAFEKYQDCKIVGARFYLTGAIGSSKVGILKATSDGYISIAPFVQKDVPTTAAGWNYVWFDEPYKIDLNDFYGLLPYYDYTPANKPSSVGNPIGTSGNWAGPVGCLALGDLDGTHADPSTFQWQPLVIGYTSSTEGSNLMMQLIIEKEDGTFILHDLSMDNIAMAPFVKKGEDAALAFTCHNEGRDDISSVKFGMDVDGEHYGTVSYNLTKITDADYTNVPVKLPCSEKWATGEHSVSVYPVQVEGEAPQGVLLDDTLSIKFKVYEESFERKKNLVEYFSNQQSKYSYFGNENIYATRSQRKAANLDDIDDMAIVDIHGESVDSVGNTLTDQFAISEASKLAVYSTSAPASVAVNRYFYDDNQVNAQRELAVNIAAETKYKDNVVEVLNKIIDQSAQLYPSFSTVGIESELNGNNLSIKVKGDLTKDYAKLVGDDIRLTIYLTENSLRGKQITGDKGSSKPNYVYNNVLRKIVTANLGDPVQVNGNSYENDYFVELDPSWKSSKMNIVAFISRPMKEKEENGKTALASALNDLWVDNTNQVAVGESDVTGIATPISLGNVKEVARYTIDGQELSQPVKGVNLVKLSNGKTIKVIVK